MTRADMDSGFDVAFWFADTALADNEYLQPQKLQRLLFLAQAYYAVASKGRALFPGVFVAEEMGPIEPNLYAAFSKGRPDVDVDLILPADIESFLDSIWRRFGHYSVDRLNETTNQSLAYQKAYEVGRRTEITLRMMRLAFERGDSAPGVDQVVKPNVYLTQQGKPVTVQSWTPEKEIEPEVAKIVGRPGGIDAAPKTKRQVNKTMQAAQPVDWLMRAQKVSKDKATIPSRARIEEEKRRRAEQAQQNPRLGDLGWDNVFGDIARDGVYEEQWGDVQRPSGPGPSATPSTRKFK